jgi:hypothetical protein
MQTYETDKYHSKYEIFGNWKQALKKNIQNSRV